MSAEGDSPVPLAEVPSSPEESKERVVEPSDEERLPKPVYDILAPEQGAEVIVTSSTSQNEADALLDASSWEDLKLPDGRSLSPEILRGVYAKGFAKPSKIQARALPYVLTGKHDLIAQAQNGAGKTAAFALAILARLKFERDCPQALCLSPTRELAQQNAHVICELGKFTPVKVFVMVPACEKITRQTPIHVIVGTPGKVGEFQRKRFFDVAEIGMLVLDEADIMINVDSSMGQQVMTIRRALMRKVQCLLFSATFPDRVKAFSDSFLPKALSIRMKKENLTLQSISQFYRIVGDNKLEPLAELYDVLTIGQSIVFVNRREEAFNVARFMKSQGHAVSLLTGTTKAGGAFDEGFTIEQREKVMQEFRQGETRVLITTDVLARGIDVPQVTLVVNLDLPRMIGSDSIEMETYLHRVGRTGRFGQKGLAVSFIRNQSEMHYIQSIESYYA